MVHTERDEVISESSKKKMSQQQYFIELEKWLHDAYMWQGIAASFPYFLMCNQYMSQFPLPNSNVQHQVLNNIPVQGYAVFQHNRNRATLGNGIECKIPAVWKRLLAEFIDFLILFVFKLLITWIAIDFFEIIDVSTFDLDGLQLDVKKMDYNSALQITHNIMILELIHRVIVCIFETCWLVRGSMRRVGGATPGKLIMGLRVVRCEIVTALSEHNNTVVVYPGTDLGLEWAFVRSFIKNLVLAIFIPLIAAFYYFPFNRAGYDMICNTIVIEEPIIQRRLHQN